MDVYKEIAAARETSEDCARAAYGIVEREPMLGVGCTLLAIREELKIANLLEQYHNGY